MEIEKIVLSANSFKEFNPLQKSALKKDWKNKSLVVSSPTASGKTIIAELCAINSVLGKKKTVYTCPLKALALEHFNDFKKKYSESQKIRFALSTGDLDSSSKYLSKYDVIFTTYEKLESLTRHSAEWLQAVGLLVIDEVHEIDSGRGPTIEMLAAKMQLISPKMQVLALSATIPNAKEIAGWLNAELVESDFRPVKLKEGVFFYNKLSFIGEEQELAEGSTPLHSLLQDTLQKQKQVLFFANTRKRAEGIAKQLSSLTQKTLDSGESALLKKKAEEILNALESPTEQCKSLSSLIEKGIAFHHAGLVSAQRHIVEELFRENRLRALSATPTLAAGVNLPAFRVVLSSLHRFEEGFSERIPVREYKQMVGRAGRPKYDSVGEGILLARSELEAEELLESYIKGEIEDITSKLGIEPVLRMHLLAGIASNFVFDLKSLEGFFSKTFFAFQYKDLTFLFQKISEMLKELQEMGFVQLSNKGFKATRLGKRVSELYIDPVSAHKIISSLHSKTQSAFFYLFLLSECFEFCPLVSAPKSAQEELWEQLQERAKELPVNLEEEMYSDPELLRKFNTSLLLENWIEEKQEQFLLKNFNCQPGILRAKLDKADWLLYCCFELSRLLGQKQHLAEIHLLRKRLKHGIKQELVQLCELKGIGRVRSRKLFNSGIKTVSAVKKSDLKELARILGEKVAVQLKSQLGQKTGLNKKELKELKRASLQGQSTLEHF